MVLSTDDSIIWQHLEAKLRKWCNKSVVDGDEPSRYGQAERTGVQ
jgi:hypothetical protein